MVKELSKKVIFSIIAFIICALLFVALDVLFYYCYFLERLYMYNYDLSRTFSLYIMICAQAIVWLYKPLKNKKVTIIGMFVSFVCSLDIFGYLAFS